MNRLPFRPSGPFWSFSARRFACRSRRMVWGLVFFGLVGSLLLAQPFPGGGRRGRRTPERTDFPMWEVNRAFKNDVFTFTRIRYASRGSFRNWNRWDNDYPDSDINFSWRLQQLTALQVDPDGKVIEFTDPALFESPFVYLAAAGVLELSEEEVPALRRYLLNGGFLMMDDFWGREEWDNVYFQMKRALPEVEPVELKLDHPIFSNVFPLEQIPQVPDIRSWRQGYTYEPRHGDMADHAPHFMGFHDPQGRLVVLACHNNDLGDGWEREGEEIEYFKQYSERWSYPMGINIITYAMTH